jgi:phage/plasmid-associated DNA primase
MDISDPELKLLLENSINGALFDIANVIHYVFKDDYVSARLKNKLWFKFDGNKWKQIEEGPYYELSTTIIAHYESYLKELLLKEVELQTETSAENFEIDNEKIKNQLKLVQSDISKTTTIIDKLKNVNFKESLCKECLYLFYDRDFISKLDKNEHLICFKNTLYDMRTRSNRSGTKEDMMSIYIDADFATANSDSEGFNTLIDDFIQFRKGLLKKRHPKNIYTISI